MAESKRKIVYEFQANHWKSLPVKAAEIKRRICPNGQNQQMQNTCNSMFNNIKRKEKKNEQKQKEKMPKLWKCCCIQLTTTTHITIDFKAVIKS